MSLSVQLLEIYKRLFQTYGPQHWWPADDPFEVCIGAILTQSTAWVNVEKAITNLKEAGALDPVTVRDMPFDRLAGLIRPSGYYNAKARKLRAFANRLKDYSDSLDALFDADVSQLRTELLSIYGIGPETADSIILYAARKPVFVIDAYTHRIMDRLRLNPNYGSYEALQAVFAHHIPADEATFNEYHALFVRHGKEVCRKTIPLCQGCPLGDMCYFE